MTLSERITEIYTNWDYFAYFCLGVVQLWGILLLEFTGLICLIYGAYAIYRDIVKPYFKREY